ncbi:MAG: hypothetical protein N2447_06385 [Thermoanaerobaculum sp.]|nr:hypothetical protein [Thermoanaerobaculum sp.]
MRVYLSRFVCGAVEENLQRMASEAERAARGEAELVVFPELFLTGYRQLIPPVVARQHFASLSRAFPSQLFCFGTFTEDGYNRLTLWHGGQEVAQYDKVHLFLPNREDLLWREGTRYVAVKCSWGTVGLLTCNDVRFPEQARSLVLSGGANILLVVAWWPWRRDHVWRTLLQARAMENASWVLGCCIEASIFADEPFAGAGNYAFDPVGTPILPTEDTFYELSLASPPPVLVDPRKSYREIRQVITVAVGGEDS